MVHQKESMLEMASGSKFFFFFDMGAFENEENYQQENGTKEKGMVTSTFFSSLSLPVLP